MPHEMQLEVDPHGTCSIGSLGLRLWMWLLCFSTVTCVCTGQELRRIQG